MVGPPAGWEVLIGVAQHVERDPSEALVLFEELGRLDRQVLEAFVMVAALTEAKIRSA
jgi:hypothetical protein